MCNTISKECTSCGGYSTSVAVIIAKILNKNQPRAISECLWIQLVLKPLMLWYTKPLAKNTYHARLGLWSWRVDDQYECDCTFKNGLPGGRAGWN